MGRFSTLLPIGIFISTAFVSEWFSYIRPNRWQQFALLVAGAVICSILVAVRQNQRELVDRTVAYALLGVGAAVTTYYFVAYVGGFLSAEFNPNLIAGINGFVLPFALVVFKEHWAVRGVVGWLILGLLLSGALGAILAFGLVVCAGWGWWKFRPKFNPKSIRIAVLTVTLLPLILLPIAYKWLPAIVALLPANSRTILWQQSTPLAMAHPFIGGGLGAFDMLHATYTLLTHVPFIAQAHNLYLNIAVAQGWLGLLAFLWMIASFWLQTVQSPELQYSRLAVQLALAFLLLQGFIDDAIYSSPAIVLLFVPMVFVDSAETNQPTRRLNIVYGLAVILTLISAATVPSVLAAATANWGVVQQHSAELTVYQWPEWVHQDQVRRTVDLTAVISTYERALALDPSNSTANFRLGQVHLAQGAYADTVTHLRAAGNDNAARQLLGEALIAAGVDSAEGKRLWQTVNNTQDQLAIRLYWYEFIGEPALRAELEAALP